MPSVLRNTIDFFERFGMFDVILPFLLVFTIVFAILEKTRVLGEENGQPKKNLDSMVAFVIALLVTVAVNIIEVINRALPNLALLLIILISGLMVVGLFWGTGEIKIENSWLKAIFFVVLFIVVLGIFFDALGWLDVAVDYVEGNWDQTVVPTFIFFIITIGAIFYIVEGGGKKTKEG